MEEFLLNFFLADVFSTMALISLMVAGNSRFSSKLALKSFFFPTHILIELFLQCNLFVFYPSKHRYEIK